MGYKTGPHMYTDHELNELVERGCSECGSHAFIVFAYAESRRNICLDNGKIIDFGYDSPTEILDDIDIECADCNAICWTDDDGWMEE